MGSNDRPRAERGTCSETDAGQPLQPNRLGRILRWRFHPEKRRITPAYTVDDTGLIKISPTAQWPHMNTQAVRADPISARATPGQPAPFAPSAASPSPIPPNPAAGGDFS